LINETKKETIFLETQAAKLEGKLKGDKVTVDMGLVYIEWQQIPLSHEEDTLDLTAVAEGVLKHPVAVNVGNPHAVFFLQHKEIEDVPLEKLGPRVENHALFPEKVNVEVAHVLERNRIRMRVWERGVGITRACGTGACAVVVAGVRRGLSDRRATVELDGGELEIEWRESDNHVLMTGSVAESFRGEIEI
jgi:diaminopimelate epimerase